MGTLKFIYAVVFAGTITSQGYGVTSDQQDEQSKNVESSLFTLKLYRTTYILPVSYTHPQDNAYFEPMNPNKKPLRNIAVEFQFSLSLTALEDLFLKDDSLQVAYTQRSNWQAYDKSAYFKDTDYQPEVFYTLPVKAYWRNWQWETTKVGFWHESNGMGGNNERSWNRVYLSLLFSNGNFSVDIKPWLRVRITGRDYNPDITHYRGDEEIRFAYQWGEQNFSLLSRNNIGSGFSRGYEEFSWIFPIYSHLKGFIKLASGYGQSISSYNYYNNSAGIGFTFQ